jgi:hypothetical protein
MQCARTILLSVTCTTLPYFPTLPHQWHYLKEVTENKICTLIFLQVLSEPLLILRGTE